MTRHVLLADPDAVRLAEHLEHPGMSVTPAESGAAARAYLSGSAFDAVTVRAGLDDGVAAVAEGLGVPRVHTHTSDAELEAWAESVFGAERGPSVSAPVPVSSGTEPGAVQTVLVALRSEIGRVAHDLANPLAVVMGSAQLGREMTDDAEAAQAFADIETAAAVLAGRLADLSALRRRLDGLIGSES